MHRPPFRKRLYLTLCVIYNLNRTLETRIALLQVSVASLKYDVVPVIPDTPTSSNHGLFEKILIDICFSFDYLNQIDIYIPFVPEFFD
jgi:hypothetical protein